MEALLHVVWLALLRVSAVLIIGLLVTSLLRRVSAAVRHCLLVLTVIGALVVPLLSLTLPEIHVSLPTTKTVLPLEKPITSPTTFTPKPVPTVQSVTPTRSAPSGAGTSATHQPSLSTGHIDSAPPMTQRGELPALPLGVWPWLWGIGSVILLARLLWGMLTGQRIIRDAESADEHVLRLANEAAELLGMQSTPPVRLSPLIPVPAISGIRRMHVLLPTTAVTWPVAMLHAALLHELAHVRRRDTLSQALVEFLCVLYWFNPFVWLMAWRMRVERETACDDAVLNAGVPNRAYADVLLESVKALQGRRSQAFPGLAMARTGKLAQRLRAIMDKQRNRKPLTLVGMLLLVLVTLAVVILAALPGARTKFASLFASKPLPENQSLIITKDNWHLRGTVKRVELYIGDNWHNQSVPPQWIETLEFNEDGRVIRKETDDWEHEIDLWQYSQQGQLISKARVTKPRERMILTPVSTNSWQAYKFIMAPQHSMDLSFPSEAQLAYDRQGNLHSMIAASGETSDAQRLAYAYDAKGNPTLIRHFVGGDVDRLSRIAYDYDDAGNWIAQRCDEESIIAELGKGLHKMQAYRFLRRITYFSREHQADHRDGIRFTRDTFNLRGPVAAIEGQALWERLGKDGRMVSFSLPAFIDRVTFDSRGRVAATTRWDGEPQRQNVMMSEQFDYYPDGTLRGRMMRNIHPNGIRSYSVTGMSGFMLGDTLLPLARPPLFSNPHSKRAYRYDASGRLIDEQFTTGDDFYAHAVCRYSGDDGLITITGRDGRVTDRIQLDITRDRYGNLLSRRYTWKLEGGAPSTRTEEVRYLLTYADGRTGGHEPGADKTRDVTVTATNDPVHGALAITLSGPTPARLSPALLPLGTGMQVLYATETTTGWFPFAAKIGTVRAMEMGSTGALTEYVSAITGTTGPSPTQGMVALEWDSSRTAGTVWGAWQLALHPVVASSKGMQRATSVPWPGIRQDGMGSPTSLPVDIRQGHRNAQLIWLPQRRRYLMVAENHEQSMPGITMATVNTDGTLATSQALRFRGYSPRLAKTRDGLALCFVQRDGSAAKGSIGLSFSKDGTQWTQSRQLFPQLTNPKEIAFTGDGHGTIYLLALCHSQVATAGQTSPARLYRAASRDNGASWTVPKLVAAFESEYTDEPSISLALDANGKLWYAFAVLGAVEKDDFGPRYSPGRRTVARIIVGSATD